MPGDGPERPRGEGTAKPRLCFCLRNVDFRTRDFLIGEHGARPVGCLGKCSLCFAEPFLEVNGQTRTGPDHATILRLLRASGPEEPAPKPERG
jgi:hypothetical protein